MAASTPELIQLLNALQSKAKKWYNIGLQLNLSTDELDIIEADGQGVEDRLRNMLKKCLNKTDPSLTWNSLIRALKEPAVEEPVLANELERKFIFKSAPTFVQGNRSSEATSDSQELQIIRGNNDKINASFAILLADILTRLKKMNLDVDSFRVLIVALFQTDSIPKSSDLVEIFESVTRNGLWNYWHFTQLEKIVEKYCGDDPEMSMLISNYKKELSGYRATTKIVDYMKLCSIRSFADPDDQPLVPNPAKYDSNFYTQLKVKLRTHVTDKTLQYVDELWRSLAEYFLLPDLSALLESIQEGCISITWLIPAHFAFQISANIQDAEEFFKRMYVIQLKLDEVCIFGSESEDDDTNLQVLLDALNEGNTDKLSGLIADGADVKILFEGGWTPLMIAVDKGHLKVAELLLEHGAKVDANIMDGWTPLMKASSKGLLEIAKLLLKHGAQVEIKNMNGATALSIACEHGHLPVAELLLLHKADVNNQDSDGWTPLLIASSKGDLTVVELLLKNGASLETKGEDGITAFIAACEHGHLSVAELLLLYKADVNAQKYNGATALMQASSFGYFLVVKLLLEHNADVNVQSKIGSTALLRACRKGHLDIVKLLLSHHADVNALLKGACSPLMFAANNGCHEIVSLLLNHQADINIKNKFGWTALFMAAKNGHLEIVQSLLQHNADINVKDKNGATAYDVASVHEQRAICEEIEKIGYKTETTFTESVRRNVVATSRQISGYFADMENRRILREVLERTPLEDMPKHSSTTEHEQNEQEF